MDTEDDLEPVGLFGSAPDTTVFGSVPMKDSGSEFSPVSYESFMIETFRNCRSTRSELNVYLTSSDNESVEDSSIHATLLAQCTNSETSTSSTNKLVSDAEHKEQWNKNIPPHGEERIMHNGQRGRPCKYDEVVISLANSRYLPGTYRKSIEKAYKMQNPSRWCHICNRSSVRAHLVPCFNRWYHRCRKSICYFCIFRHYLQKPSVPPCMFAKERFFCSHCLGICPENSQCKIYQKTNLRRHIQSLLDRNKNEAPSS